MRVFDREVVDAVWDAVRGLLPERVGSHPLGCHRPRVSDRLCFWGLLVRLAAGASWTDIEAILEWRVSDTVLCLISRDGFPVFSDRMWQGCWP